MRIGRPETLHRATCDIRRHSSLSLCFAAKNGGVVVVDRALGPSKSSVLQRIERTFTIYVVAPET
jgi:hypothetical protein